MSEYINVDEYKRHLNMICRSGYTQQVIDIFIKWFLAIAESIATEDVAPVVHARWVNDGYYADFHPHMVYRCSNCDWCQLDVEPPKGNYCPNCGAKMDGEKEG